MVTQLLPNINYQLDAETIGYTTLFISVLETNSEA